jgi:hypothetical protein
MPVPAPAPAAAQPPQLPPEQPQAEAAAPAAAAPPADVLRVLSGALWELQRGGAALLGPLPDAEAEQLLWRLEACSEIVWTHTRRRQRERGAAAAAAAEGAGWPPPPLPPPPQTQLGPAAGEDDPRRPAPSTPDRRAADARRL